MKKVTLLSFVLLVLTACGGGGGSKGNTDQGVSGRIIDAPLSGSQIFVDLNKNFAFDVGEPSTVSNENGYFSLASLTSACTIPACNAQIVALGGKDIATGQDLPKSILIFDIGLLSSPSSNVQVSPISSAVSLMGNQADSFLALIAPGINKSDLLGGDLWLSAAGGNSAAKSAVKKIEQIGVLMNTLAAINPSTSGANVLKSVVGKLAAQAGTGQNPLKNQAALKELIDGVALELGNTSLSSGIVNTLSQALSKYLIAIDTGDLDPGSPAAVAVSSASQLGLLQKIGQLLAGEITEQQFLDDTDLAALVDSALFAGLTDTDKDGIVDVLDPDDDNDGVPDGIDAFPLNQETQLATVLRATAVGNVNCPNGGVSVESGIDENGNGTLDNAEVDKTDLICHGTNAVSSLLIMSSVSSGELCPNGGIQIHTGPDSNADGVLSVSEIENTKTLCNAVNGTQGQQGAPGKDSVAYLISQVAVPVGSECQYGGTKISSGRDTDGNGQLSAAETSASSFACNGAVFAIRTKPISDANICVNGGIQIETGIDANVNGVLDNSEVSASENICNGQDGRNALINLTTIEAGPICQNGGMQVQSGPDLNNDHILSPNEVSAAKTICNAVNGNDGANGRDGANYIVDLSPISSGHPQCANGGARVDAGLDSNRNGVLDSGEVSSSVYICNGANGGSGGGTSGSNTPPSVPATTTYNIAVNQSLASTLAASDIDGDRISFEIASSPEHGSITSFSSVTGEFTYQPNRNYEGPDSFEYQADDGRQRSSNSLIAITVAKRPIPAGSFQVNSEALQIIDYPDGISPRTFILSGATQSSRMQAHLEQPAALSALNLQALAEDEPAEAPLVSAELLNLPSSNGTSKITISLFDGYDENREVGERQVSFTYVYDWVSDGSSVSVSPTPGANAEAIYFTRDGELAVSVKLKNETANIFSILNGNQLAFTVASLFSDDQLGLQFKKGLFKQGSYFYRVVFDGFPVVDSYGLPFNSIAGRFYVSQSPVPYASSGSRSLSVREGQLTQANFALAGSGGTGTLNFAVDQPATTGTMNIDSTTGKGQFTPLAANLLVDDAIGFNVSDGFLQSNPANYRLNIVGDADINSDLLATFDVATSTVSLAWTDNASDETGYRVESYDMTCRCWIVEENLAASDGSWVPYTWTRAVTETRYYRVFRLGDAGDELMAPGVVVANVGATPTLVLDQEQPVAGYVNIGLENTPPLVNRVDYYVDLTLQCRYGSFSWPDKSCRISTSHIGDGNHQLRIQMEYQERSYVVMTSQFSSAQPPQPPQPIGISQITHTGSTHSYSAPPGEYEVQILPSSAVGITGIDFNLDQVFQGRMTSPNSYWGYSVFFCSNHEPPYPYYPCRCETEPAYYECTQRNYDGYNAFTWHFVNPAKGTHRYDFLVEAGDGDTREGAGSFLVPLELVLDQPVDSTISSTTLVVSGSVANTNNPISITVTLGDITILRTEGPNFHTEFDMTGLPEKNYTLRVNAVEINGYARSSTTKTLTYTP